MFKASLKTASAFGFGALVALAGAIAFLGCSQGTGSSTSSAGSADGSVSVTDAASDQISSFEVDVTALDLVRADGAVVHALPQRTRVDFAELVNESQLLSAFSFLAGTYTSVSMTLDFSNANVVIAGSSTPASVTDTSGNPITGLVTEKIRFLDGAPLVVLPGLHNDINLDFNLDASCSVDPTANTVQLGPVILATETPAASKVQNVYGQLASVDAASSSFTITVNRPGALVPGPSLTVQTTSSTVFHVGGVAATFAQLASAQIAPPGTAVLAQGGFNGTRTFTAFGVEAWTPMDFVEGHVLSRDVAGHLVVLGRGENLTSGALTVNSTFTVDATAAKVFQRDIPAATSSGPATADAIGVGQRIVARGTLSGLALDATKGHVTLLETGIFGYGNGPASGSTMAMRVARIGRRPIGLFNFDVPASSTNATADPSSYVINVGSLAGSLATIASGTPVAVRGIVTPWKTSQPASTGPNANALTVTDRSAVASLLYAYWPLGKAQPFATASSSGVKLDLTGTLNRFIDQGFISPVRFLATDQPSVVPPPAGAGLFVVRQDASATIYSSFASWESDVSGRLASGGKAFVLAGTGGWASGTLTLTAPVVVVHVH